MIYDAILILVFVITTIWTVRFCFRPIFRVTVCRTAKGNLQIRIYRKMLAKFPPEAGDHDTRNCSFSTTNTFIIVDVIYPTREGSEEVMVKTVAKAKHLCSEWNDGKDSVTRLQRNAQKLIKGK